MKEFRFECKFCNKSIYATYDLAGKKVKCPYCKNPVIVPLVGEIKKEGKKVSKNKKTKIKERPIQKRYKGLWIKSLIKLLIIGIIIYIGYNEYCSYKEKSSQNIKTLLEEAENGGLIDKWIIVSKVKKEDLGIILSYSNSDNPEIREIVALCLGKIRDPLSFKQLKKFLEDKSSEVRIAAAKSLRNFKTKECVKTLIFRLDKENNDDVKGEIGRSLREITGQRFTVKGEYWKMWWNEEGKNINDY